MKVFRHLLISLISLSPILFISCGDPLERQARQDAERDLETGRPCIATWRYSCGDELHPDVDAETGLPYRQFGECDERDPAVGRQIEAYNAVVRAADRAGMATYLDALLRGDDIESQMDRRAAMEEMEVEVERHDDYSVVIFRQWDNVRALTLGTREPIEVFQGGREGVAIVLIGADRLAVYHVAAGLVLQVWRLTEDGWAVE